MVKEMPAFATELKRYGLTLDDKVNSGNYGGIYALRRTHSKSWEGPQYALKLIEPTTFGKQRLEEKGLTPTDLINSEFLPPDQEFLIPRSIISLGPNLEGVLMPFYQEFADSTIGKRWKDAQGVELATRHFHSQREPSDVLHFIADVFAGVNEFYTTKQRAHGDIKLENIAYDRKGLRFRLGDFGSSHYADWSVPGKVATRVGDPTIRAPELFSDESWLHPTRESDAWSLGALLFTATTGEELWQNHVNYNQPVPKVGADLENFYALPIVQKELNERIKKVPAYARELVRQLLVLNEHKRRIADATLVEETRKLARRYDPKTNIVDIAKSYSKSILATMAGALVFSFIMPTAYELSDFNSRKNDLHIVVGNTSIIKAGLNEKITYERQTLTGSGVGEALAVHQEYLTRDDAMATVIAPNDETYRLLWKAVRFGALAARGGGVYSGLVNDEANSTGRRDVYSALARRLKVSLDAQRKQSTTIKAEDVFVRMFWGDERLNYAKKKAGPNFASYSQVRINEFGDRIIPDDTDSLIGRTVDYINAEFATRNYQLAEKIVGESPFK